MDIHNRTSIIVLFSLISASLFAFSLNIETVNAYEGTIVIQADGLVTPENAPFERIGDLYLLTDDITFENAGTGIMVNRTSNIVIDGQGHNLTRCGIYTILAENVTIKNFHLNNCGITLSYESANVKIHNNTILGGSIYFHYSGPHEIIENIISGASGIFTPEDAGESYTVIARNNITSNGSGIKFNSNSINNTIIDNNISNNVNYGIYFKAGTNNYIAGNNVIGNRIGIYMTNYFDGSVGQYGEGVSQNNIIVDNYFASNTEIGISIVNGTNNPRANFRIGSDLPNYIYHNIFENNAKHVSFQHLISGWNYTIESDYTALANVTNVMDDGYPSGGNYWDDYTGIDADCDGIGDEPYVIDDYNIDRYPLVDDKSFFAVPEIPLGTVMALISSLAAFTLLYTIKSKKKIKQRQ